jgi:hypothetical protein
MGAVPGAARPVTVTGAMENPVGSTQRAKDGLRSMDMTTNCLWFSGSPHESVSSHSWREFGHKGWAELIVRFTDLLQQGHCASANRVEQPIVYFIENRK